MKWIWTSRLSIKNSLSLDATAIQRDTGREEGIVTFEYDCCSKRYQTRGGCRGDAAARAEIVPNSPPADAQHVRERASERESKTESSKERERARARARARQRDTHIERE